MAKHVLIFGAGASYDSDKTQSELPPLGSALFDKLAAFNKPGWGSLEKEHGDAFRKDFEHAMQIYGQKFPGAMPILQRAMAGFFFNFPPKQTSLYFAIATMAKEKKWDGGFVTFNYERLLPISLACAGYKPIVGSASANPDQIELCFPHGYCMLFCDTVRAGSSSIFANTTVDGKVREVPPQEFHERIEKEAIPPVMSYFLRSKDTMAGVTFIKEQRKRYEQLVTGANKVAIIGMRLREHDKHIWEPIAKSAAEVVYCSGANSGAEFEKWTQTNRIGRQTTVIPKYFREGFDEICSKLGLGKETGTDVL